MKKNSGLHADGKLSVCIITKNEEEKLRRCLTHLRSFPFEIVVTDTGSTDGTLSMLAKMQKDAGKEGFQKAVIKVCHFSWCSDFAAAKNFAVSQAENDMVFVLDSDEYIERLDLGELMRLVSENPGRVGRIVRRNQVEQNGRICYFTERVSRIFSKRRFLYEGRIHEQVVAADGAAYDTYDVPVWALHDGYLGTKEQRAKKAERNRALLEEEMKEKGEDPYLLYQIGKSFYMSGDYEAAANYFSKGLSFDLEPALEYVIDMVETYGYALIHAGRAKEALFFENIYDTFGNTADFRILMGFIYMNNERFGEAAAQFVKAAECSTCRMEGANSYLAYYNAGVVEECLGNLGKAAEYYKRCGSYEPARERRAKLAIYKE